ncbi:hypothetical protein V8C35DRAFT_198378 [Trichoderma chlorosporum]
MDSEHEVPDLPTPAWTMLEFTFSTENTDSEMVAMCNGRRVVTHLCAENFSQSPPLKEKYLFFLQVAEHFELEGYTIDDFHDWIAEPLLPIFRRLDALQCVPNSLEAFPFPESQSFTLRTDKESLVAIPCHEEELDHPLFGIDIPEAICSPWPSFKPSMVQPCGDSNATGPTSALPSKVLLPNGSNAFLKLMRPGDRGFLLNELKAYTKIRDAHLDTSLRISRLLGLVRNEGSTVFGLLLMYVDCGHRTLSCAVNPGTDTAVRRTWAKQIEDTIAQLHQAGIVWGDAKPDNILIDLNNDAWLVDFGGSYTEGWVPEEQSETVEGDLAALEKIKHFIEAN